MKTSTHLAGKKLELIQWLSNIEDSAVINKIIAIKNQENIDWWNTISEKEKNSIELGLQDAEAAKLNSHSKAKELYEKWL
ncbi:MAG: hypothetical protein WCH34_05100 [Bacteroidota bacterium]